MRRKRAKNLYTKAACVYICNIAKQTLIIIYFNEQKTDRPMCKHTCIMYADYVNDFGKYIIFSNYRLFNASTHNDRECCVMHGLIIIIMIIMVVTEIEFT